LRSKRNSKHGTMSGVNPRSVAWGPRDIRSVCRDGRKGKGSTNPVWGEKTTTELSSGSEIDRPLQNALICCVRKGDDEASIGANKSW